MYYFCNLEKRHYEYKLMHKIIKEDKTEIVEQDKLIETQKEFYENLYKARPIYRVDNNEALFWTKTIHIIAFYPKKNHNYAKA